jgi:two-component system, sensor histidine kinase and response regulator
MIRDALLLTALIIAAGILGAQILTLRITTPLRSLASVARQVAEGDMPAPLTPRTNDEVGQLTNLFNMMTRSLHERNVAIQSNVNVIQRQISQLSAVHQTSAAITSTLDLHQLLDTVLQLLMNNLGFSRMLLMLRQDDRNTAYVAQIAGVSPEIAAAACELSVPIQEGDTFIADLLIHGKPVHVHDLESEARRMHPQMLALARQVKVSSFVAVPLQRHSRILGFLVGDRESSPCTGEDLSILVTIASHVSSAIDNARAYGRLTELTQHLEQRIDARTRELSIANERLQDHDRRRTMFVSVASHELRTPMTAIRSFADNMLDGVAGPLTERQTAYLTRIGHNLNRLTRIINQLLDWSRLDLQKEVLRIEPLSFKQMAMLVVDSLRTVADEKHIAIELRVPDDLPSIQGDRDKLEQVLWNLIGNAVKFTPPHGVITVTVDVTEGDMLRVCVNDTGCGIAPEHVAKIFDEFSKVPPAMPTSQGARLGLFITKSLITMHGGRIWVESRPAMGTQVFFLLPCTQTADAEEG